VPQQCNAVLIRPLADPRVAIDLRVLVVELLERELEERFGGNAVLNRLEAEAWVDMLARGEIPRTEALAAVLQEEPVPGGVVR